jgi:putative FmdB family regulatory protein
MMPVYTYRCPSCGAVFDSEKAMADPHPVECSCGFKGELGRVYRPTAITFRGSGFYAKDKALDTIIPEYELSDSEQTEYYDEKLRHGDDRKVRVFT